MTTAPARSTVVLLHGVGLDHRMWAQCVESLPASLSVATPDLPGHGTAQPVAAPLQLADLARDVIDSCSADSVHLVGFSLGALIAQRIAIDRPDRVRSLTLVSSVARRSPQQRDAVLARLRAAREDPQGNLEAALERWTGGEPDRLPPRVVEYIRGVLSVTDRESFVAAYEVFASADQELDPLLSTIAAPTILMTGGDDPGSTPEMTHRLASAIPDANATIVDGARHLLPLERPSEVAELLLEHVRRHDGHC